MKQRKKYLPPFMYAKKLGIMKMIMGSNDNVSFTGTKEEEENGSGTNTTIPWAKDEGFGGFGDF